MGAGQGGSAVSLPGERRSSGGKHRGGFGQRPGECHNFREGLQGHIATVFTFVSAIAIVDILARVARHIWTLPGTQWT